MKKLYIIALLATLFCLNTVHATNNCDINLFGYDQTNWYNMAYGFTKGLYNNPPDSCSKCSSIGSSFSSINKAYIYMESLRSTWVNYNSVVNQSALTALTTLITLFGVFYSLFYAVDVLYQDSVFMSIPTTVITMISSVDNATTVYNNIDAKLQLLTFMLTTMPGADCSGIGYRMGVIIRNMFSVSYD